MLINFTEVQNIFIVCGHSDMRCGIDGLASLVSDTYNLDLFDNAIFLFVGEKKIATDSCYCIRESKMEIYSDQKTKMRLRN